jgi:predicted  nucleic acid-binding Zn-ribbon protein
MTDRARHVYALLRTLLAWTPAPPASRTGVVLAQQQRGFVSEHRYVTCPDCLANGRPEGMRGCESCGGRGEIPDDSGDPYEQKRIVRYGLADNDRRRDQVRQRDDELRRLEFQLAKPVRRVDEQADDALTRASDFKDRSSPISRMYRRGSYAELEQALGKLRDRNLAAYDVAMMVAYQPFCEEPIEPVRRAVVAICEVLAAWMPGTIRVPASVPVWTRDELNARADVLREQATWRGRKDPLALARRDEAIRHFSAQGMTQAEVAERVGVHPRTVARVLSRPLAA